MFVKICFHVKNTIPYAIAGSDAVFNLGGAMTAVQLLPPGVYVAMNSRIIEWNEVKKDRENGVFTGEALNRV